jgi:polar amino acid transport system substrate-binding protein
MSKLLARVGIPALAILAFAGCGSSNNSTTSSTASNVKPGTNTIDATIAGQVPSAIKSKGTLTVASEAQYAPNEFIAPDGHTIVGMDADLTKALGEVTGLKVKLVNSNFETIIPGLAAGRYDLGASSFTDTKEREKTVDFVDYFNAGISFYAKATANPGVTGLSDLCGKTVAVEKGTVEQEESQAQSKKCAKEAKKGVNVLTYPGQDAVNLAISSGRAEVGLADSPVVAYQIKQANGQFKIVGKTYAFAPYGLAIPRSSGMTKPIAAALQKLIENGTYTRILEKWGLLAGAISTPKINGATS